MRASHNRLVVRPFQNSNPTKRNNRLGSLTGSWYYISWNQQASVHPTLKGFLLRSKSRTSGLKQQPHINCIQITKCPKCCSNWGIHCTELRLATGLRRQRQGSPNWIEWQRRG